MTPFPKLKGLIAAPFTPMNKDGSLNIAAVGPYAEKLVGQGIAGVFICGTTGEGFSMTPEERKTVAEAWVKASASRLKVIVHAGHNCREEAAGLAAHAQDCGACAIASIAPNFYKPGCVEDLIGFFAPVAAAAQKLPFYYYNMPSMSGVSLPVDSFLHRGAERIPNLQGVKFTHNNLMEMIQCLNLDGGRFEVLHGYDEILLCGLALGVQAAVGSTYNYAGRVYAGLIKAFDSGNLEKAREYQSYCVEIVKVILKYGGGVRGGKAIMNLLGIPCGECRTPINRFTAAEYENLRKDLDAIDFFDKI
ncbi:MAG: dihydrodipicolinate synthase family protein [Bacteroidales bacterium]|nr:dihydrodipicolinate synthase family protein [Bacteroidales bacterium]